MTGGSPTATGGPSDFKNTVIIMTSNIGAPYLLEGITARGRNHAKRLASSHGGDGAGFRPEFLNRVDDIVLFKPLTLEEIKKITDLLAHELSKRLKDRQNT